jgi:hypothetical protein
MFVFPRSALAVILPLALLFAVVAWSNRGARETARRAPTDSQAVVANLPSR